MAVYDKYDIPEIKTEKGNDNMMRKISEKRCRKIFGNSVILLNGMLLFILMVPFCALLVMIDIVWMMMDGMVRKLEGE